MHFFSTKILLLVVDDASELFGIEGSSTDQASVDLGHGHEFVNTVGGDGSTVLDTGGLGDIFVVHFGQDGTQKGVCLVWNSICCMKSIGKVMIKMKLEKKKIDRQKLMRFCISTRKKCTRNSEILKQVFHFVDCNPVYFL